MRVLATKSNKAMYLETNKAPEIVTDHVGLKYYYIQLPPLDEIIRSLPTPLLEDIFHEANFQLQLRDKQTIPDKI